MLLNLGWPEQTHTQKHMKLLLPVSRKFATQTFEENRVIII